MILLLGIPPKLIVIKTVRVNFVIVAVIAIVIVIFMFSLREYLEILIFGQGNTYGENSSTMSYLILGEISGLWLFTVFHEFGLLFFQEPQRNTYDEPMMSYDFWWTEFLFFKKSAGEPCRFLTYVKLLVHDIFSDSPTAFGINKHVGTNAYQRDSIHTAHSWCCSTLDEYNLVMGLAHTAVFDNVSVELLIFLGLTRFNNSLDNYPRTSDDMVP